MEVAIDLPLVRSHDLPSRSPHPTDIAALARTWMPDLNWTPHPQWTPDLKWGRR